MTPLLGWMILLALIVAYVAVSLWVVHHLEQRPIRDRFKLLKMYVYVQSFKEDVWLTKLIGRNGKRKHSNHSDDSPE